MSQKMKHYGKTIRNAFKIAYFNLHGSQKRRGTFLRVAAKIVRNCQILNWLHCQWLLDHTQCLGGQGRPWWP